MLLQDEVTEKIESQRMISDEDAVGEALRIEKVLNLAHEIRRARGGLFGYDLEDWLQAERELAERNRPDHFQVEQTAHVEPLQWDQERNSQKCFGLKG